MKCCKCQQKNEKYVAKNNNSKLHRSGIIWKYRIQKIFTVTCVTLLRYETTVGGRHVKRVGIITFLHNDNYGSTLQAYALQTVIRNLGYDCVHLDYRPDSKEKILNLLRSGNSPKLILDGLRKRSVQAHQAGARNKRATFTEFYGRHMRLTPVCRNRGELRDQAAEMDILVCGSDQIWSPVWMNPAYFLDFAGKNNRRVAYAASLGVQELPVKRKQRKFRRLLKGFDGISVRETEGAELIRQMTGTEADVLPDPVCLPEPAVWKELAEEPAKKLQEKGARAVPAQSVKEAIEKAEKTGRPVVAFGSLYSAGEIRKTYRKKYCNLEK